MSPRTVNHTFSRGSAAEPELKWPPQLTRSVSNIGANGIWVRGVAANLDS
jgi:hypothetical protein